MLRLALIGTGNLGIHLATACSKQPQIQLVQWIGRTTQAPKHPNNIPYFTEVQKNIAADLCIIAVQDDQIGAVAEQLIDIDSCIVHTSGAAHLNMLRDCKRSGVLYPLQSFVKDQAVDWTNIPICIEANNATDLATLEQCARALSTKVFKLSSQERATAHLAAVFANNFTNHMVHIGQALCAQEKLPTKLLDELLKTTFERATNSLAENKQTGPAKRNDVATMEQHLKQLDQTKKNIYNAISKDIYNTHNV